MKIILAKNIGFCGGVSRAFNQVEKEFSSVSKIKKRRIFVLGSLAHNRGVESRVDEMGIKKISDLRRVKSGDVVIVTAHGVSKVIYDRIKNKGAKVFDTTCVNVKRVQSLAKKYQTKGWKVIVYGDKDHKEVKGILGHCNDMAEVVKDLAQTEALIKKISKSSNKNKPFILISQTTKNINIFILVREVLERFAKENSIKYEIFDTICRASHVRQKEAEELAKKCQLSVVIGGAESANTKRLWQICRKHTKKVFWVKKVEKRLPKGLIERASELKRDDRLCIISGASTPPWEIAQVKTALLCLTR